MAAAICSGVPQTLFGNRRGTYILWLQLDRHRVVRVGRLGRLLFRRGCYGYVGSALGPGGLDARLKHHLRPSARPHWHVDYLKPWAVITEIWSTRSRQRWEHVWADLLYGLNALPVGRFGASDCACPSHLFCFSRRPRLAGFRRQWRQRLAGSPVPPIRRLIIAAPGAEPQKGPQGAGNAPTRKKIGRRIQCRLTP